MSDNACDALVIGAGPAGSTAALLLARGGWRVAIVEKAAFPRRKVCGEFVSATTWPLLAQMGVADALLPLAGRPVSRVGVFAGRMRIASGLPLPDTGTGIAGRAIGREHLDSALLDRAVVAGAELWQPWSLTRFEEDRERAYCEISERGTGKTIALSASVLIAAHGAWEPGVLPAQQQSRPPRRGDLLGFKARFRGAALPADLMPLFAFPGGYGGLVNSDGGALSLSCCVRRDTLAAIRGQWPGSRAGEALQRHIVRACAGVAAALADATLEDNWLAAGPLATGIRTFGSGRIVAVGNAAAEAHPIVAEGISMAIQSAHLAAGELLTADPSTLTMAQLAAIRRNYARAWRRNFSARVHAAALYAHLFMRPAGAAVAAWALQRMPGLLTLGAHWSGKDRALSADRSLLASESHR